MKYNWNSINNNEVQVEEGPTLQDSSLNIPPCVKRLITKTVLWFNIQHEFCTPCYAWRPIYRQPL